MQHSSRNITKVLVGLTAAIVLLRLISLGIYPLFDPTEGRYAEIGRKMLELNNWVTPFIEYHVPFWAKPPLSFWMTAISYKIFGVSVFASRLPSFLMMMGMAWLIGGLVKTESDRCHLTPNISMQNGLIATLILISMGLFFYLAGGVMTDPSLGFGVTLIMVAFWRTVVWEQKHWRYVFFAGVSIALLAKGPIGVVLSGMPIFLWTLYHKQWKALWQRLPWISGTILTAIIVLPWYILAEIRTPGFLHYFIIGEHFERFLVKGWKGDLYGSGRAHPIGTIWVYAMITMLPWSLIMLVAPFKHAIRKTLSVTFTDDRNLQFYLWLWGLTPLIFFTMARNILTTYTVTALPAFAMLLTPFIANMLQKGKGKWLVISMAAFVPLLFTAGLIAVNLHPHAKWVKSQEAVIKTYRELAHDKPVPLVYIGDRSYSADFYSRGKALSVKNQHALRPYLSQEIYVVIPRRYYQKLSTDLRKQLPIVADENNTVLLHNTP